jgi:SAM-dependent methyltransferase
MNLPEHLGGHLNKTHVDEGSLNWIIKEFSIKSFLDVGCGPGGMVNLAKKKSLKALGVDGDYTLKRSDPESFILHDYTQGPLEFEEKYDLCWSCEFVEHVEETYIDNYMRTINCANLVVITHAPPGWPGHHHVNCQTAEYWIDVFKNYNFIYNDDLTKLLRKKSTMAKPFIQRNGLFFTR